MPQQHAPIGVQLYSVREQLKQDFAGTVRRIAAMGYTGVETAGEFGGSVTDAVALFKSLGLEVTSAHSPLPLGEKQNQVLDTMKALGTKHLICPWLPPERFETLDGVKAVCDELTEANEIVRANGLQLSYHNHHFEFLPLPDGSLPYTHMVELLPPTLGFEIDTYWVEVGGTNAAELVHKLGKRANFLHIKDGPLVRGEPMLAVGEGKMNFVPILAASQADWLIVELDSCATDMMVAVERSYQALVKLVSA